MVYKSSWAGRFFISHPFSEQIAVHTGANSSPLDKQNHPVVNKISNPLKRIRKLQLVFWRVNIITSQDMVIEHAGFQNIEAGLALRNIVEINIENIHPWSGFRRAGL